MEEKETLSKVLQKMSSDQEELQRECDRLRKDGGADKMQALR